MEKPHGLLLALKNATSSPVVWSTSSSAIGTIRATLKAAYSEGDDGYTITKKFMIDIVTKTF